MSAWIVSADHIDYLLTAAVHLGQMKNGSWIFYDHDRGLQLTPFAQFDTIGAELIAENVASVGYRYHETDLYQMPGPIDKERLMVYQYKRVQVSMTLGAIAQAVACYEYQSCEHPGWNDSKAKALCDRMNSAILRNIPGWDDADTWPYDRPRQPQQTSIARLLA